MSLIPSDALLAGEGYARNGHHPVSTCVCRQPVVVGRTENGEDVTLDGHPDGGLLRVRGGTWLEVAVTADVLGRRPLVVAETGRGGMHRLHQCPGIRRRQDLDA